MNKVVHYFTERRSYLAAIAASLCVAGWSVYQIICCVSKNSMNMSRNGLFHVDIILYELLFVASGYALFFGTEAIKKSRKRKTYTGSLMES
ncbi:MAG: hypothetical protein Q4C66_16880 [Lachnospiraceae bacterium]|nr:hypothetical protein [Lachnospiraceae bacterium]